ncbi:MAG TPA: carboxymuconolactone decarboxylase family protein [Acidimicrobiales bacterium]|nr:carboxymuconolactone decarboxylase family protein [Acidimicrobiales bacterium]
MNGPGADERAEPEVRLAPAPIRALGPRARLAAAVAARATGGEAPRVLTTLARHRRLFRRWLPFSTTLLLRGDLPRVERELVILRTAWRCRSWYEWAQHVPLARRAGLPADAVDRVADGPEAAGWTPRQRLLLLATDEMHDRRVVGDPTWTALADELTPRELIELCFVVGHYEMLAMTLNSLGVRPEPSAIARLEGPAARRAGELRDALVAARR